MYIGIAHFSYRTLLYVLLLSIIAGGWFIVLELNSPFFFSNYDNATYYLPHYFYNWHALVQEKSFPLINFHQFLGTTHLALGQSGALYPPIYISLIISQALLGNYLGTIDINIGIHLVIAAVAMFFLLRQLNITNILSFLGSLLWVTLPYFITMGSVWSLEVILMAYLPLNYLFIEKIIHRPAIRYAIILALIKTMHFFGGYPEHIFMVGVFDLVLITAISAKLIDRAQIRQAAKIVLLYSLALLLFILMSAPQLLPMIEAQQLSAHRSEKVSFDEFMGFPITLKTFIDAQLFRFHAETMWWASSYIYSVGAFNLALLTLLAVRKIRRQGGKNHLMLYAFLALVAYLISTTLHKYLYGIPPFYFFRRQDKHFPIFTFFLILTIIGITAATSKHHKFVGRLSMYVILLLSLTINVATIWFNKDSAWNINKPVSPISTIHTKIDPSAGRIITIANLPKRGYGFVAHNFATLYNVFDFAGYDMFVAKTNLRLALGLNYKAVYDRLPGNETLDYLSSWSVRYLLTPNNQAGRDYFKQRSQLKPLYQDKEILLFENTGALPYVYDVEKPKEAVVHKFGINEVNIFPTNKYAHQLTVNIAPLPRYIVYFDGNRFGRVISAEGPILIDVPPNTNNVLIRYEDPLFRLGVGLFLAVWLVIILFYLIQKLPHSKRPSLNRIANNTLPGTTC